MTCERQVPTVCVELTQIIGPLAQKEENAV